MPYLYLVKVIREDTFFFFFLIKSTVFLYKINSRYRLYLGMLEFEVIDWGFFSICLLIYYLGNAENMLNDAQA